MAALRSDQRTALCLLATTLLPACTAAHRQRAVELALFPVNVVPDAVANTLVILAMPVWAPAAYPDSNIWPVVWIFAPVFGPSCGIRDAWHGYPFWDPGTLDSGRYEASTAKGQAELGTS